jgi:signal transduction histidine kinase
MWIATRGEGIFSYDPQSGKKKHYTTAHGLSQNFVFGVIVDKNNKLWFSSENGLSKFDPSTEKFRNYDFFDGLPNNRFDDRSEKLLPDGRIYMGTAHGFTIFNPEKIQDDTSKSRVILSNLVISNKLVNYYRLKDNKMAPVGLIDHIVLTPDQKDISFGFSALHYSAPHKIMYKYKLENFDKEWINTNANNRVARYTNLDGGKYTFYVMASNGDGIWNSEPLKITVTVQPPLVKTLGFRIIAVVLIGFLIFMITRWQKEQVINQNVTLARLVDERTQEISEKNNLLENNAFVLNQANVLLENNQKDIEAQKEELSEQRDMLIKLNATKDKLFSVIAHDLKNPFNVIIGFSELMLNNYHLYTDEKRIRITSQINQASRVAFQLLENLLEWSRTQKGSIIFDPTETSIGEILNTALLQVKDFSRNKGIKIQLNQNSLENMIIKADVNMLNTIFRNLLSNAVKFSHKKGVINIQTLLLDHNMVRFSIIDQGVGMSRDTCNQLFKMEKNTNSPGTEGEKGTGLGLLICKEFIEAHNGRILVESEPGEGTTFHFAIPVS